MRRHLVVVAAVAVAAGIATNATAAPPVVDGKKLTTMSWKVSSGANVPSEHDVYYGVDNVGCKPPRCDRHLFVWKPAKGVTAGNVLLATKWTTPATDWDVSIVNSRGATIASCGGFSGTGEAVVFSSKLLTPGQTYTVVTAFASGIPDSGTSTLQFPTKYSPPVTGTPFGLFGGECTINGSIR